MSAVRWPKGLTVFVDKDIGSAGVGGSVCNVRKRSIKSELGIQKFTKKRHEPHF
jgi:hypothetical protein